MVQLAIFNWRCLEKVPLHNLSLVPSQTFTAIQYLETARAPEARESGPPFNDTNVTTQNQRAAADISYTPAWSPGSRLPMLLEQLIDIPVPSWLHDRLFSQHCIKLIEVGMTVSNILEFWSLQNDIVLVRDGTHTREVPLDVLHPIIASRKEDAVVCTSPGPNFGQLFKIKPWPALRCVSQIPCWRL
ncbi:unnamed protein product [Cyclocybe aegerita]|uniref:Uncharacterized protein n=1 Tax=Cyclocybe aegerita TaxID=1973307 RepID=A0A8S0X096_CYCAE|nr:unnamed protein product [Cyclocybe aegerita]